MDVYESAVTEAHKDGGRFVTKEGWFWRALGKLIWWLPNFLTGWATTIGPFIGLPVGWTPGGCRKAALVDHEAHHVRSFACLGLITCAVVTVMVAWTVGWIALLLAIMALAFVLFDRGALAMIGIPLAAVFYLLFPIPIGLAWGRWVFERGAYLRAAQMRLACNDASRKELIDRAVDRLGGSKYAWAWPKDWVRAWFERRLVD